MTLKQALEALTFSLALILFAVPVSAAGICDGGPDGGRVCSRQSDCDSWCNGGPYNHVTCDNLFDCGATCEGGANHGRLCTSDSFCRPGGFCHIFFCRTFYCISNPSAGLTASGGAPVCGAAPAEIFASP
jgi:hypothetical protein